MPHVKNSSHSLKPEKAHAAKKTSTVQKKKKKNFSEKPVRSQEKQDWKDWKRDETNLGCDFMQVSERACSHRELWNVNCDSKCPNTRQGSWDFTLPPGPVSLQLMATSCLWAFVLDPPKTTQM